MPDTETEVDSSPTAQDVQSELMDMIIADKSPSDISDKIKDMLYAKSAEKVDSFRPEVASDTFGDTQASTAGITQASGETSDGAPAEE